jgi:hypothetical protein
VRLFLKGKVTQKQQSPSTATGQTPETSHKKGHPAGVAFFDGDAENFKQHQGKLYRQWCGLPVQRAGDFRNLMH